MRCLMLTIALSLALLTGPSPSRAAETASDRATLETQIARILRQEGRVPESGISVWFDKCVVVVRTFYDFADPYAMSRRDVRVDLSFVVLDRPRVEIDPKWDAPKSHVSFHWRPAIEDRLNSLADQAFNILLEEARKRPSEVGERLKIIAQRYQSELTDKIYFNAGQRVLHGGEIEIMAPLDVLSWTMLRGSVETFFDLMQEYQRRFCGEKAQT